MQSLLEKPRALPHEEAVAHRPVRVCFLIDELNSAGTETQLLALIRHCDRRNVQPFLVLLRGENATSRRLEPKCCPVLRLGVGSLCRPRALVMAVQLSRFLKANQIEVLQVYFPDSTYFGTLAGRLARVPFIVRTRNNLGYWQTPLHRWLGRLSNRLTDATIANCEAARQALLAAESPKPESVVVLENGVDLERFAAILPLQSHAKPWRVGILANLRPVKNLDLFVKAAGRLAKHHRGVTFEIAGEGEQRAMLTKLIGDLELSGRIRLSGAALDVPAFLSRIEIAVLCSQSEGMSNAVLEYMAAGRAIVATDVGANSRLLSDARHGLLIPPGDEAALAAALDRVLSDSALAARLGSAARQRAERHYSRQAMVRRFELFYRDLTSR